MIFGKYKIFFARSPIGRKKSPSERVGQGFGKALILLFLYDCQCGDADEDTATETAPPLFAERSMTKFLQSFFSA